MDEFTRDSIRLIREDVRELKSDIKTILTWRAMLIGYAAGVAGVVSLAVAIFFNKI